MESKSSCTTLLVGKKASYDGSTLMGRTEDTPAGVFNEKQYIVVKPENQPKKYKSVLTGCEVDLPDNPLQYTAIPNADKKAGVWGEAGINCLNVGMSETETITSNALILGADPLVDKGIGEEDYLTIVLPYIKTAREGVLRLGELLEKYGTCEMNGVGFQDENEVWWLETIGGHHYIAKRVPDDCYVVNPNQQGIDVFDFVDAFGKQENHICSKDFIDFISNNHLDLSFTKDDLKTLTDYKIRRTVGSHTDFDYSYNTCRAWFMLKYFNPHTKYEIEDFDLPWCMKPEYKISIQDVKYVLSSHYQNTKYDPYLRYGDDKEKGKYRPIGVNRTIETSITQIRSYLPDKIKRTCLWVTRQLSRLRCLCLNPTTSSTPPMATPLPSPLKIWYSVSIISLSCARATRVRDSSSTVPRKHSSLTTRARLPCTPSSALWPTLSTRTVSMSRSSSRKLRWVALSSTTPSPMRSVISTN
ncbi:MAG: C69 family dipeptidase [Alphaproteobacteria bacterium]|nr:C69 family dipeptidase [Alphaproteobacteria bacterium]